MTIKDFIDLCIGRLAPLYPAPEAKSIAFRLLEHFTDIPSYKYISDPSMELQLRSDVSLTSQKKCSVNETSPASLARFPEAHSEPSVAAGTRNEEHRMLHQANAREPAPLCSALDELATGRPLQYVLGVTDFYGHRFKVGEGCLIPRPETEELVSRMVDELSGQELGEEPFNILDLCTGSGCIAWSLAAAFPEAMVYGCDLSDAALRYACKQRVKTGGAKPIFFTADVLAAPPAGLPPFDVIVSNPPYICESERAQMRPNVLDFEPAEALFVPDDDPMRFYKAIARWADALLRPGGRIFLEINERFGPEVAAIFPGAQVFPDLFGKDRFVIL
jgi:release factor glutamine methyltransferase